MQFLEKKKKLYFIEFHWRLFLEVQLSIKSEVVKAINGLAPNKGPATTYRTVSNIRRAQNQNLN